MSLAGLRAAALACVTLTATSCGWHSGLGVPAGARTVGVEAAQRDGRVLERGLEPQLTDALSEAVVDWVQLPLVAPAEADLVLRSTVLEYRRRGGVRNRENELVETAVYIRAHAELFDRRYDNGRGRVLGQAEQAQEWSGFALDDPNNEDAARKRALRHVAVALVLDLFEPSATEAMPKEPAATDASAR